MTGGAHAQLRVALPADRRPLGPCAVLRLLAAASAPVVSAPHSAHLYAYIAHPPLRGKYTAQRALTCMYELRKHTNAAALRAL